ncbi:MAG: hypothetical protein ACXQS3_01390 [Candidatus Methanofastidiosia archaeon]
MKMYSITKLNGDSIILSSEMRQLLGISDGSYLLIEVDRNEQDIVISKIAPKGTKLIEMNIVVKNIPGANAKIDLVLGENNINILFGEGEAIDEETYVSVKMLDIKDSKLSLSDIENSIYKTGVVKKVELTQLF